MRKPQQSATRALIKTVSRGSATPIYRQIYERVRRGIAAGSYQPGARLPSARELASDLGVARGTVEDAYGLLLAEGYIERRGQRGSVVAHSLSGGDASARLVAPISPHKTETRSSHRSGDKPISPFQLGQPAFDAFPQAAWSRLVARFARRPPTGGIGHPDHDGYFPLKIAISRYLGLSRGVVCSPFQILITNGYQAAIDLVGRSLLRPGDTVWFEEPGYVFGRDALLAAGAHLVPVGVDEEGLKIAEGIVSAPTAKLIVTTPAHQSPLCVALSLPRRLQLLEWARAKSAWIIEDDYDGEFHYGGRPLPALKSLDRHDRVIYAGSFSKTLLPELRLGYLVVPLALVERLAAAAKIRSVAPGLLMQAVVAEFLNSGQFARHLHRMRRLYADRRQALADALVKNFGNLLSIEMQNGGMHLLARLPASSSDIRIAEVAAASELAVTALSRTYMRSTSQKGLLLGFTNVPAHKARSLCRALHREIAGAIEGNA